VDNGMGDQIMVKTSMLSQEQKTKYSYMQSTNCGQNPGKLRHEKESRSYYNSVSSLEVSRIPRNSLEGSWRRSRKSEKI